MSIWSKYKQKQTPNCWKEFTENKNRMLSCSITIWFKKKKIIESKFFSNIWKYNLPRVTMMRVGNSVLLVFSVKERLTEHTKMYALYIKNIPSIFWKRFIYDCSIPANDAFHKYKVFSSRDVKLVAHCPPERDFLWCLIVSYFYKWALII